MSDLTCVYCGELRPPDRSTCGRSACADAAYRAAGCDPPPAWENAAVTAYWLAHYLAPVGVCGLCGNSGIIDTRGRAISARGVEAGGRYPCVCPNGQVRRAAAGVTACVCPRYIDAAVAAPCEKPAGHDGPCRAFSLEAR